MGTVNWMESGPRGTIKATDTRLLVRVLTAVLVAGTVLGQSRPIRKDRVEPGRLGSHAGWLMKQLDGRLSTPGKERLTATGTITESGRTVTVTVLNELPNRIRYAEQTGKVIAFDGMRTTSSSTLTASDEAIFETLSADTPDFFFRYLAAGLPYRLLGTRFPPEGVSVPRPNDPLSDIYEFASSIPVAGDRRVVVKHFYFDSRTGLLQRVRYQRVRGGVPVNVEVTYANWRRFQGEIHADLVTRRENGTVRFVFNRSNFASSAKGNDNVFTRP